MTLNLQVLNAREIQEKITARALQAWESNYLAHYSSYWNGISTDPRSMLIPLDDHLVHRGDGVFEAFRWIKNKFYLLDDHLERLHQSAKAIDLKIPWKNQELRELLEKMARVALESQKLNEENKSVTIESNLIFRLFVSRGAGSFTTNPYECPDSHLHIVACRFKPMDPNKYLKGVQIGRSHYLQKSEFFAQIKSCNYLLNVLMKKEAVDRKLDFVVSFNENSHLGESSTENIFLLSKSNELIHPQWSTILKGTTLRRVLKLAEIKLNLKIVEREISENILKEAKEVFMAGTTLDILPVSKYENVSFEVGPMGKALYQLILNDQSLLTFLTF